MIESYLVWYTGLAIVMVNIRCEVAINFWSTRSIVYNRDAPLLILCHLFGPGFGPCTFPWNANSLHGGPPKKLSLPSWTSKNARSPLNQHARAATQVLNTCYILSGLVLMYKKSGIPKVGFSYSGIIHIPSLRTSYVAFLIWKGALIRKGSWLFVGPCGNDETKRDLMKWWNQYTKWGL